MILHHRRTHALCRQVYKCDADTSIFQKIIGSHFKFTCAGQDWLKAKWHAGEVPTYQEFAHFGSKNELNTKKEEKQPKEEWAYLHFIKEYVPAHPNCTHQEVSEAWAQIRLKRRFEQKSSFLLHERTDEKHLSLGSPTQTILCRLP